MQGRPLVPLLLVIAIAGCSEIGSDEGAEASSFPLEVFRFAYPGSDAAVAGFDHGWLVQVRNPTQESLRAALVPFGIDTASVGPIGTTGGDAPQQLWLADTVSADQAGPPLELAPGEAGLFLVQVKGYPVSEGEQVAGFQVRALDVADPTHPYGSHLEEWTVTIASAATAVSPDHHVQTATVGVYPDGTSFYTNIAALHADRNMTRDYDNTTFGGDPLPVYVYGQARGEQPAGSRDTCHFTTISGYNTLLKTQAAGSTNVRYLRPEEAYTLPGNEEHALYGEALVFLNTVVAHDGPAGPEAVPPDPTGACYCPENIVPRDTIGPADERPVCELLP